MPESFSRGPGFFEPRVEMTFQLPGLTGGLIVAPEE